MYFYRNINKHVKTEIENTMAYTITLKKIFGCQSKSNKNTQDFYAENYKILLKEIKKDPIKWNTHLSSYKC